jgi:hypothetical protein
MLCEAQIQFPLQSEFLKNTHSCAARTERERERTGEKERVQLFLIPPLPRIRLHFISILLESPTNTSRESRFTPAQRQQMRMRETLLRRAARADIEKKERAKESGSLAAAATDLLRGLQNKSPPTAGCAIADYTEREPLFWSRPRT